MGVIIHIMMIAQSHWFSLHWLLSPWRRLVVGLTLVHICFSLAYAAIEMMRPSSETYAGD
jgi:hypothetical protein